MNKNENSLPFITVSGSRVGRIGQGTWFLGEDPAYFRQEADSLRAGIEHGMTMIDTAEMYGGGAAETLVGDAIRGYDREKLYLVSKVLPYNAGRKNIFRSCEDSMRRMKTDYLDLYLLHWRGSVPFAETVECMQELVRKGRIRRWGVSNMDLYDMDELLSLPGGSECLTDQVLYHLGSRGIEFDLLPWLADRDIPVMAYCPLAQAGRLRRGILRSSAVNEVAKAHNATPQQIMLAFLITRNNVIPIPRTSKAAHAVSNAEAASIALTAEDLAKLDAAFPAPDHRVPLDME